MTNSREIGRMAALLGLDPEQLADLFGVDHEWAWQAQRGGAWTVAQTAWESSRPSPYDERPFDMVYDAEDEVPVHERVFEFEVGDAHRAVARFARAYNTYVKTPRRIVPPKPTAKLVTKMEDTGDGESGPSISAWLEVVPR